MILNFILVLKPALSTILARLLPMFGSYSSFQCYFDFVLLYFRTYFLVRKDLIKNLEHVVYGDLNSNSEKKEKGCSIGADS